jgi:hypothetical protein
VNIPLFLVLVEWLEISYPMVEAKEMVDCSAGEDDDPVAALETRGLF